MADTLLAKFTETTATGYGDMAQQMGASKDGP